MSLSLRCKNSIRSLHVLVAIDSINKNVFISGRAQNTGQGPDVAVPALSGLDRGVEATAAVVRGVQ